MACYPNVHPNLNRYLMCMQCDIFELKKFKSLAVPLN